MKRLILAFALLGGILNITLAQDQCAGEMTYYDLPEKLDQPEKVKKLVDIEESYVSEML